ncbi:hypothetical protein EOM09_02635 [bacterium]|nr:hypothetical protein [bacterium]
MLFRKKKIKIEPEENKEIINIVEKYRDKDSNFNAKEMLKLYNVAKPKNKTDIKGWKYRLIDKYKPLSSLLINMQLTNGKVIQFVTTIQDFGFVFDKGYYIVDDKLKYFNVSSNMYALDYHEELCFPIQRNINISEIKEKLIDSDLIELKTAINPISLNKFMESTVIQKLLAGAEMEDSLRFIKVMVIITGIIGVVTLLLVLNMSGII